MLKNIHWEKAQRRSLRACSRWAWPNRSIVSTTKQTERNTDQCWRAGAHLEDAPRGQGGSQQTLVDQNAELWVVQPVTPAVSTIFPPIYFSQNNKQKQNVSNKGLYNRCTILHKQVTGWKSTVSPHRLLASKLQSALHICIKSTQGTQGVSVLNMYRPFSCHYSFIHAGTQPESNNFRISDSK